MTRRERLIGIVVGLVIGLAIVSVFVVAFSDETVDPPSLSSGGSSYVK